MNRRSFIAAVGAGAAAGASIAPAAGRDLQAKAMVSTYVTNIPTNAAPVPGDTLQIRRDGKRSYDPHAVEILTKNGQRLGHLPPIHSRIIEPLLAGGFTATAWGGGRARCAKACDQNRPCSGPIAKRGGVTMLARPVRPKCSRIDVRYRHRCGICP